MRDERTDRGFVVFVFRGEGGRESGRARLPPPLLSPKKSTSEKSPKINNLPRDCLGLEVPQQPAF